jgi:hypothetical protein
MRFAIAALLLALAAPGCGTPDKPGDDDAGGEVYTPADIPREKKRVLELLRYFEGRNEKQMDEAAIELLEMPKEMVQADLREHLARFQDPSTRAKAADDLRHISKRCRVLSCLESGEKEAWRFCFDTMVAAGPQETAYLVGALITRYRTAPDWSRWMLMDVCVAAPQVAVPGIVEALMYEPDRKVVAHRFSAVVMDSGTRDALCSVLVFLPQPPVSSIQEVATRGPVTTRKAMAKILQHAQVEDKDSGARSVPPWGLELLGGLLARDTNWEVRAQAADSLGRANDAVRALPLLVPGLKDGDYYVRKKSVESVGRYGAMALPVLADIVDMLRKTPSMTQVEERSSLEASIIAALRLVTGKAFVEPGTWIAWFEEQQRKK